MTAREWTIDYKRDVQLPGRRRGGDHLHPRIRQHPHEPDGVHHEGGEIYP